LRYTQEIRIQAIDSEWAYCLPETTTWAGKVIGELKSNGRQILYVFGVSLEHITLPTTTEDRCLAQKNSHKKFQLKTKRKFYLLIFVEIVDNWKPLGHYDKYTTQDVFLHTYSSIVVILES
jgi:hypothetical protein